jgi:hypothetical protein
MEAPLIKQSRSTRVRGDLVAPVLLGLVVVMAACSSPAGRAGHPTTTTAPPSAGHSMTGTIVSATPPLEVAQASIEISDSSVTIKFASRVLTGPLHATDPVFAHGHLRFTFSITGVTYTLRAVAASGPPGDLIGRVTVSGSGSGVTVHIGLHRAAADRRFTVAHDQVGVDIS